MQKGKTEENGKREYLRMRKIMKSKLLKNKLQIYKSKLHK